MDSRETRRNIKLGAFVLAGVTLLLTAVFFMGKQSTVFNKTFTVASIFKNVEGLKDGDAVWLSGVKIGIVQSVRIIDEGKVIVKLSLNDKQNQFLKSDATAFIGSDGLVGNKIVVIRPGSASSTIHENDTINSFSPTDTQELFNLAKEVGSNTRTITDDLKLITAKLNKGQGIVGELLHDGELSLQVRDLVSSLKRASEHTNKTTEELQAMVKDLKEGNGLLAKLIHDSTYVTAFETTMANVKEVGDHSKVISNNLKDIIQKMDSNNSAIGVLLADPVFANKMRTTLSNAQSASAKLDENMEALQHNFLLRGYFRRQEKKKD